MSKAWTVVYVEYHGEVASVCPWANSYRRLAPTRTAISKQFHESKAIFKAISGTKLEFRPSKNMVDSPDPDTAIAPPGYLLDLTETWNAFDSETGELRCQWIIKRTDIS